MANELEMLRAASFSMFYSKEKKQSFSISRVLSIVV